MDMGDSSFPIIIRLMLIQCQSHLLNGILEGYDLIPGQGQLLAIIFTIHLRFNLLRLYFRWFIVFSQLYISFSVLFVLAHHSGLELFSVLVVEKIYLLCLHQFQFHLTKKFDFIFSFESFDLVEIFSFSILVSFLKIFDSKQLRAKNLNVLQFFQPSWRQLDSQQLYDFLSLSKEHLRLFFITFLKYNETFCSLIGESIQSVEVQSNSQVKYLFDQSFKVLWPSQVKFPKGKKKQDGQYCDQYFEVNKTFEQS